MTQLPETIQLGPRDEAHRLWDGAQKALSGAADHLVDLCEAIDLGVRAAEILATLKLQPARNHFPNSIAMLLEAPAPEVDPERDALAVPRSLKFLDVIDMLSQEDLDCVNRKLHHGWEDRRCSCRRARAVTLEKLGMSLDEETREQLLVLEAYRNRIFRTPPPVTIVPEEILRAFPALKRLYEGLEGAEPS